MMEQEGFMCYQEDVSNITKWSNPSTGCKTINNTEVQGDICLCDTDLCNTKENYQQQLQATKEQPEASTAHPEATTEQPGASPEQPKAGQGSGSRMQLTRLATITTFAGALGGFLFRP